MAPDDSVAIPPIVADSFVSYARADAALVAAMVDTLRAEGFTVWFDESLYAGAEWESLLLATLSAAKAVLVVWSRRSITSAWVLKEAQLAREAGRLVPIRIDDCALPSGFEDVQTGDMKGWDGRSDRRPAAPEIAVSILPDVRVAGFLWDERPRMVTSGPHGLAGSRVGITNIEAETGLDFGEAIRSAREISPPN